MKTAIVFVLILIVAVPGFVFAERIHVGVITGGYEFPPEFLSLFSEHEEWELTRLAHPKA
ncbi:hypothetical protein GF373_15620, partial [bacterium]|nr:hypothetical protein [bacterium]